MLPSLLPQLPAPISRLHADTQFPDTDNPGQGLVSEMGTTDGEVAYSSPSFRRSGVDSQEDCTVLYCGTALPYTAGEGRITKGFVLI
jgi:hypothetical protein